ncbi:hypothetical protein D3C76_89600 [compost metagenome]
MNSVIAFVDIAAALLSIVGFIGTLVMYAWVYKTDRCSLRAVYDLLMYSVNLTVCGKNFLTALNWGLGVVCYGALAYYGHFWFINVSIVLLVAYAALALVLRHIVNKPAVAC